MTDNDLKHLTNQICLEYFNESVTCPVVFDTRLRTSGGSFKWSYDPFLMQKTSNLPEFQIIQINPYLMDQPKYLIGTIKHELCHWYLWNYHDNYTGHGTLFMRYLRLVGGTRYAPLTEHDKQTPVYIYCCQKCGAQVVRRRKFNTDRYICSQCRGHFALIHQISLAQAIADGYLKLAH